MKVEWKKLMFGFVIGVGMMMMVFCSDEENFDFGGSIGKEILELIEKVFFFMCLFIGLLVGIWVVVDLIILGCIEE